MVNMIPTIRDRGRILESSGFKPIDALHVAAAEQGQAEVLVTCDDGLLKTAQRHAGILQVKVMSVLRFIAEEI
jgi:predicted nucleic acid-binding protein